MVGNNTNIVHVEAVENLCISIQGESGKLEAENAEQFEAINEAREFMRLYQRKQVKALRDVFEEGE